MTYQIKEKDNYKFIDEGSGEVLLLLHGLMGALSNWEGVINGFKGKYRVIIPMMPIYDMPIREAGLDGLTIFIDDFVKWYGLNEFTLIGNSLGGHIALLYTLQNPESYYKIHL